MARKRRSYGNRKKGSKFRVNLSYVIVIICIAVAAGYLTTRYFIYPVILGQSPENMIFGNFWQKDSQRQEDGQNQQNGDNKILEDGLDIKKADGEENGGQSTGNSASDNTGNGTGISPGDAGTGTNTVVDGQTGGNTDQPGTAPIQTQTPVTGSGYCIQYGSFSSREAAQELADELKSGGIEASVLERDNAYKVIGELFTIKEEAASEREKRSSSYTDVFITQL